ncbi:MAG TPA: glycosyltransferase family 1 protein [Byssovorax sp.]
MPPSAAPDVLLDVTPLDTASRHTGTGRYVAALARAIAALSPREREGLDVRALTSLDGPSPVGPLTLSPTGAPPLGADDEVAWLMARRTTLAATLRRIRPRLFHAPVRVGTPRGSLVPRVVTCLDLIPLVLHADYMPGRWAYRRLAFALEAARFHGARRVVAISRFTADELVRVLGVPASRVDAVPLGVDLDRFHPARTEAERAVVAATLARRGLDLRPYLVHVGAADPRKNVDTLVEGFARARLDDVDLVFVGRLRPADEVAIERAFDASARPANVRRLGYVPDDELPAILSGALALPFTSSYEGFGFTPLEAMACGCPVIASAVTSIAEVCGGATLDVPPRDARALAAALRRLIAEPTLAADLRRAGALRASTFDWRSTALGTIASYARALRA